MVTIKVTARSLSSPMTAQSREWWKMPQSHARFPEDGSSSAKRGGEGRELPTESGSPSQARSPRSNRQLGQDRSRANWGGRVSPQFTVSQSM